LEGDGDGSVSSGGFTHAPAGALGDAGRAADVPAVELRLSKGDADTVTVGGVVELEWELGSARGSVPMRDEDYAAMIEAAWLKWYRKDRRWVGGWVVGERVSPRRRGGGRAPDVCEKSDRATVLRNP